MDITQKLRVAFLKPASLAGHKTLESYLSASYDTYYRFLCIIAEAMSFEFEIATYSTGSVLLPNGSWTGAIGMINRSEVDMTTFLFHVTGERSEAVHFPYPYRLYATTFIVKKSEFTPEIFGLFKAFSWSIWMTLTLTLLVIVALKFQLMKPKYTLQDVLFEVLSVFLRQSSIMKPATSSQCVAICNWMFGAMFIGFCYTSVLLSFLTFPTIDKIKDMRDLADAVVNDGYKCMLDSTLSAMPSVLANSESTPLATIGENMLNNPNCFGDFEDFLALGNEKAAFFINMERIPILKDSYFMSDDFVVQSVSSMAVRKDFCCKERLDTIVHRIVDSGIYAKVVSDRRILSSLKLPSVASEEANERQLTLTEFSLAFIALILGYVISFAVLAIEILSGSKQRKLWLHLHP